MKGLEHYNRAIQLKPKIAEAYEHRAVLFAKMGRKADAGKDLATLRKLNPKLAGELEAFLETARRCQRLASRGFSIRSTLDFGTIVSATHNSSVLIWNRFRAHRAICYWAIYSI